ncbi:hypothetical protein [Fictibacillus sp. KU28468]|uniref:hypothetical protein n=1 Tax=Fictibacillus sp. KU28468 TaxID=2991053 RepID=UPI00223E36A2|nr:hypothetical protein [Fictibacillus sp. KU28468]UZJ78137.1 hypothetical protein OKX00_18600 [Fictibacillus sp. KU28468]
MISVSGGSLSAGRAVSLTGVNACGSLTCHASPAGQGRLRQLFIARRKCEVHFRGVSHLAHQSTFH